MEGSAEDFLQIENYDRAAQLLSAEGAIVYRAIEWGEEVSGGIHENTLWFGTDVDLENAPEPIVITGEDGEEVPKVRFNHVKEPVGGSFWVVYDPERQTWLVANDPR